MSFTRDQVRADYDKAHRRAFLNSVRSLILRQPNSLIPYRALRDRLKVEQEVYRGMQEVPVEQIVGSVDRFQDFDRAFFPRQRHTADRWMSIDTAYHQDVRLPPVQLYKVGDIYFVKDGNHRVSVARANGFEDIEAYVTRVETPVRLDTNTRPEDLVLKAAYADFLRATHLDELRPDLDLEVTEMYSYTELLEHIAVHRHYMGLEQGREIANDEAVQSWYDRVYLPVAAAVWASDILERFPGRTPADLYIWVCRHREALADDQGVVPSPVATVADMTQMDEGASPRVVGSVKRAIAGKPKAVDLAAEAARAVQENSSRSAEDQPLDAADG